MLCAVPVADVALILVLCVSDPFAGLTVACIKWASMLGWLGRHGALLSLTFSFKKERKALPCGLWFGLILTGSYDTLPLVCSLSSPSKFKRWDISWSTINHFPSSPPCQPHQVVWVTALYQWCTLLYSHWRHWVARTKIYHCPSLCPSLFDLDPGVSTYSSDSTIMIFGKPSCTFHGLV